QGVICPKCGGRCTPSGRVWRCQRRHGEGPRCNFKKSMTAATWFLKSKLPVPKILRFIAGWLLLPTPRLSTLQLELSISKATAIHWSGFCRLICMLWSESVRSQRIGGRRKQVEVDEAMFGHRVDALGRWIGPQWVFGAVERNNSKTVFLTTVEHRDGDTLIPLIHEKVMPGSHIFSDEWGGYVDLQHEGYRHSTVNHSHFMVDPTTKNHIQNIERVWRELRRIVPK
ncbi:ISXO2-like transposase domain, partial [Sesbania bispinosa]